MTDRVSLFRRLGTSCLLVGVLVAAAACGGSSKPNAHAEFKEAWRPQAEQLANITDRATTALSSAAGRSKAEIRNSLQAFAGQLEAVAAKIRGLKPPPDLRRKVDQITSGLDKVARDMRDAAAAVAKGGPAALGTATGKIAADGAPLQATLGQINAALGIT